MKAAAKKTITIEMSESEAVGVSEFIHLAIENDKLETSGLRKIQDPFIRQGEALIKAIYDHI